MVSRMVEMMVEATTKEILLPGPRMGLRMGLRMVLRMDTMKDFVMAKTSQLQGLGLWMGKMTDYAMGRNLEDL